MTKVQFIKTAGGEELAILPKSEYERLVKLLADEDVGTARVVRNARERIGWRLTRTPFGCCANGAP